MQLIARDVLRERYAHAGERSLRQVQRRVATALAEAEAAAQRAHYTRQFLWAQQHGFVAGGRINAGAGSGQAATLINCFVQPIADAGVDLALAQAEQTMRRGGGVGLNFSLLAPSTAASGSGGPLLQMRRFDQRCAQLATGSARRGALMAVLNIEHPDIAEFVVAKRQASCLHNFNLSVGVSDAFMRAVADDAEFDLLHRARPAQLVPGMHQRGDGCWIYRRVRARALWQLIAGSAYASAEPGVLFLDRINRENNLGYCETIAATNPCGEQPLPDYGACCLGSIDLTACVTEPFTAAARFDFAQLRAVAGIAVRMLDNVLDITAWPLAEQREQGLAKRRIGLGMTGLGDALIMLGLRYDRRDGRAFAVRIARALRDAAYRASTALAQERGPFPLFDAERCLQQPFIARLPAALRAAIRRHGVRNSHLLSIAPAGSISLAFCDNVSNGVEPAFAWCYRRWHRLPDGVDKSYAVEDFAHRRYRRAGFDVAQLPAAFRSAAQIAPADHVRMVAALTPFIDAGISKTVNVSADCAFAPFERLYWQAWQSGVKGLTTYRPTPALASVLVSPPRCNRS